MRRLHLLILLIICALIMCLLSSCGDEGDGDVVSSPTKEPELSIEPSGHRAEPWACKVAAVSDVDCPEGALTGSDEGKDLFSRTQLRLPCQQNGAVINAVSPDDCTARVFWAQLRPDVSSTFTGIQMVSSGGPRVDYFSPPGGNAGSIVTIVGEGYATSEAGNLLKFNEAKASALDVIGTSRLVTTVPINATSGPITLETPSGTAISTSTFMTDVTSPGNFISKKINLRYSQVGVAVNPMVKRIYYAVNRQDPSWSGLMMVDAASQEILSITPVSTSTNIKLQGVAVSPNGRRVYVACDQSGVCVFDAINNTLITIIPVVSGQDVTQNPQGIALSPDGQLLYVANNRDGGAVSIVNTNTYQPVASITLNAGYIPQGVTVNPDGLEAYFAFSAASGQNGQVSIYDVSGKGIVESIEVGEGPIGIAVTPDGNTLYVSNELESTVDVIDTRSHAIIWTIPVSAGPTGLAISPDGENVYVACRYSNHVNIISVKSRQVSSSLSVSPEPLHVTFTPDGEQAYVTHASIGLSEVIGGSLALSIAKTGSGSGIVRSYPGTIECGTSCQDNFDNGTIVTLAATPDNGSSFEGWDGAPDCLDGVLFMDTNKDCVAVFNSVSQETDDGSRLYVKCFIATAAYGSYLDPHVQILRDFRDDVLLKYRVGQILVDYYYEYSPPIASKISEHEALKAATRIALTPLVLSIKYPVESIMVGFIVVVFVGRRIVRTRSKPLCD